MSEKTASKRVKVVNAQGLHARPADMLARCAIQFQSHIELVKGNEPVDGKSILSILTLAAEQGTVLSIRAVGPDADEAVQALAALVEQGFSVEETPGQAPSPEI